VEYRAAPATRALAITDPVTMDECGDWWTAAFAELHAALGPADAGPADSGAADPGSADPASADPGAADPRADHPGADHPGADPGADHPGAAGAGPGRPRRAGPDGALYPAEFFADDLGDVTAFIPVTGEFRPSGRARLIEIPAAELAVTVHQGPFAELDQAYGALGTFVAEREIGVQGPIREHYLISSVHTDNETQHRTEVCWPVFRTKGENE
jgi:effector-binding domain-containing protein